MTVNALGKLHSCVPPLRLRHAMAVALCGCEVLADEPTWYVALMDALVEHSSLEGGALLGLQECHQMLCLGILVTTADQARTDGP